MATTFDTAHAGKILIYDGDCPMCRATIGTLLAWRLIRPEQTVSNHDLDEADLVAAHAAGLRNELVVLDPQTRETRRGADALVWIIRENARHPWLLAPLALPGPRHLLRWGYQIVSYNRRIISPPANHVICECEPEVTAARRLSLIVPATLINLLLLVGTGSTLFAATGSESPLSGMLAFVASVAAIVVVSLLAAFIGMSSEKRLDYLGHVAVTMLAGSLAFVPAALLALVVPRGGAMAAFALSAAASLVVTIAMQPRRVAALGLSQAWTFVWVLAAISAGSAFLITTAMLR